MLLRRYHEKEEPKKELEIRTSFIEDIELAFDLAIQENIIEVLKRLKVDELKELAKEKEIEGYSKMKKEELIEALRGE